jgi:hypothetical protein
MTTTDKLSEYGIESLTTDGEWKIGHDVGSLADVTQFVFGRLAMRSSAVLQSYWSDLYHDALWMQKWLIGAGPTEFWFAFDQNGTHIGFGPLICRFRQNAVRVTVWLDINKFKRFDAMIKIETVHRPMGWRV